MTNIKSRSFMKNIFEKEKKRTELIAKLLEEEKMVRGSFCVIHVKCGGANCRCAKGDLHKHTRMSWTERGKSFSRAVPKEDYEWIDEMTKRYREFKKIKREITKLDREIKNMIDKFEEKIVTKCRKKKSYLDVWNQ